MFGFFASQEKKMRDNAGNWLELAEKVYHYRRDRLTDSEIGELQGRSGELRGLVKERAGAEKLKLSIERLEEVLRRTGGAIYPKSALVENVEFFLVAAIVILGIRTYFVQPFKIPTNSMWPTYNGMTPEAFVKPADEPSPVARVARLLAFGADAKRVDAPADGEVMLPLEANGDRVKFEVVPGRTWLVFPTKLKEYRLIVGNAETSVRVPMDFDFEWAVRDAFFPNLKQRTTGSADLRRLIMAQPDRITDGSSPLLRTGKHVKRGERVLSFDIITGDQLFVDRMSYHFVRPSVGSGFVFRTGNIPGIGMDQYYIKRLVGTPGDVLEIREPVLYRNGQPITGAKAFSYNASREERYSGYFNSPPYVRGYLNPGEKLTIPPGKFFAMGDNSGNSQDSRYWGFVPGKDVVGRPLFVYYPFTKHWGPAQ
ncbi:MAG: signal peptidase I [Verrucomicrobiota bacterium]